MEAFAILDVVDHVFLQEGVDIECADLALAVAVDAFEGGPWLEVALLCELYALLFNDLLVL